MSFIIPPRRGLQLRALFSALLLFPALAGFAQARHTISGYVRDGKSGEQLIGATIRVKEFPDQGAVANEYGFYSLTLQDGSYTIIANSVGYAEKAFELNLDKDQKLEIVLQTQGRELNEVVVNSRAKDEQLRSAQMGVEQLNMQQVNQLPVLFGERDVLKAVQLLPGVKSAGEGNSGFFVRGGAADQNLIELDEALVYNPSHLFGFFSTFNSDAIKDVTLYKGNMPAQYGGRLASVTDVTMKDGSDKEYHAAGGIGLIASRLSVEGPIVKDKGSFLVSGRRTYADLFLKLSGDSQINRNQLYFYDLNLKASYRLSDKDRLFVSGYFGQDKLGLSDLFGFTWGNSTGTARWNHQFSPKVFSNTSLIYNDYRYDVNLTTSGFDATIKSRIKDWTLKQEFSFFANTRNTWRFGLQETFHRIEPGTYSGSFTLESIAESRSLEHAVYVNNSWKPSDRFAMEYGLRVSGLSVIAGDNRLYNLNADGSIRDTLNNRNGSIVQTYVVPEPRASASYRLNEVSSVKGAYSRNAQYLHLVTNSASSNPTDKWIATNNIIKPEIADQVSAGYFRNFRSNRYEASVEGYYKYMQNQIDYRDGANVLSNDPVEPQMLFGIGRAYGVEFLLRKREGRLTGWIGYTLSRTERKIGGINGGEWYAARQDRTHDVSVVAVYELSKKWTLSGTFVFYTGNAVSFPSGKYRVGNQIAYYYTERNGYRMPDYHRLDLSATWKLKERKNFSSELAFGLYNAYGRQNAYVITFQDDPADPNRTQAVQTALFRFVPSITYNFKF